MLVVGLATVYTSCMPCGFLPLLIYLCTLIKKKKSYQKFIEEFEVQMLSRNLGFHVRFLVEFW